MPRNVVLALPALLFALVAQAQGQPQDPVVQELPAGASIHRRPPPSKTSPGEKRLVRPGPTLDANDALDELLDELAADLARIGSARVSPMLLHRIRVSDSMNPEFVQVLEARLVAAVQRATAVNVMRCFECTAAQGQVVNGEWVLRQGITDREDLQAVAAKYGARMLLTATMTLSEAPASMALDVELVDARDASVSFAEGYRIHPYTAMLYRTGDRIQTREARLKDLEDRLNQRPQWRFSLLGGGLIVPVQDHPQGALKGFSGQLRFAEAFGEARTWRAGFSAGGVVFPKRAGGALVSFLLQHRINADNVYAPQWFVGGTAGFLIMGEDDNALNIGGHAEVVLSHTVLAHLGLAYQFGFDRSGPNGPYTVGGLVPSAGMGIVW